MTEIVYKYRIFKNFGVSARLLPPLFTLLLAHHEGSFGLPGVVVYYIHVDTDHAEQSLSDNHSYRLLV